MYPSGFTPQYPYLSPSLTRRDASMNSGTVQPPVYNTGYMSYTGVPPANGIPPSHALPPANGMPPVNGIPPSSMNGHAASDNLSPTSFALTRQHAIHSNRRYSLEVVQQPVRARMCGFGDKDRRPITPPPCVRLKVMDATTGNEIKVEDIDSSFFVLLVDLAPEQPNHPHAPDVTLVKSSQNSPAMSISAASTTSYPPAPERPYFGIMSTLELANYYRTAGDQHTATALYSQAFANNPANMAAAAAYLGGTAMPLPLMPPQSASMYTRNIIGSLAVNAFKLQDCDNVMGLWFILQDLSIRTEGKFRLKMQFVDVSGPDGRTLTHDKAPILATAYSDTFQVYSAKKFPGVIESTPLSKAFAGQGIKIPIRKDGPKTIPNAADFENDGM